MFSNNSGVATANIFTVIRISAVPSAVAEGTYRMTDKSHVLQIFCCYWVEEMDFFVS